MKKCVVYPPGRAAELFEVGKSSDVSNSALGKVTAIEPNYMSSIISIFFEQGSIEFFGCPFVVEINQDSV